MAPTSSNGLGEREGDGRWVTRLCRGVGVWDNGRGGDEWRADDFQRVTVTRRRIGSRSEAWKRDWDRLGRAGMGFPGLWALGCVGTGQSGKSELEWGLDHASKTQMNF